MNEAHLHMVVNHFPIIGMILGLIILLGGLFLKNNTVKNVSYFLIIIAAVFSAISMATGEGAEELVENMPEVGKKIIHIHEEAAEKFAIVAYLSGIASLIGLYMNIKQKAKANLVSYVVVVLAVVAAFLSKSVGTTGGEVRHTEIRENGTSNQMNTSSEHEDNEHEE